MATTDQLQQVAIMRAQGCSGIQIAEATGLPVRTTYNILQKDELNQLIKQAQNDLIKDALSIAIDNQVSKIKSGKRITTAIDNQQELSAGSVKLLELAHDSEKQLLQSVGIHPSHTQSIQINNILVDARSELSPAVEALLVSHFTGKGDAIEAEYEAQEVSQSVSDE
jgi:hypothetical protein